MEVKASDLTTQFEAVKIAMTQDKNGHILKLAINPADTPEEMLRDPVGQRYQCVFVRLDEDDQPILAKTQAEGLQAIRLAATLCHNTVFQTWLNEKGWASELTFQSADAGLKEWLGIASKKDFKTNGVARRKMMEIRGDFQEWVARRAGR